MGRTLTEAKRMPEDRRRRSPAADRGKDAAKTNDRDTDKLGDDASNTSDDRRPEEGMQDRREQVDGRCRITTRMRTPMCLRQAEQTRGGGTETIRKPGTRRQYERAANRKHKRKKMIISQRERSRAHMRRRRGHEGWPRRS